MFGLPLSADEHKFRRAVDNLEEFGSWTPIDTSGASLSFSSASGRFHRIGSLVHFTCVVTYPATASGANAQIGGLPFTCNDVPWSATVGYSVATATGALVNANSTTIQLYANPNYLLNSALSSASIYLSGFYTMKKTR